MRRSPKPATQLVDDQRRQRFAFDVFGDDQQRTRGLHDGFEDRQHRLQVRELLLVQQDVGIFEIGDHLVGIGDEVRRQVAAVELHAFDDFQLGFQRLGLLDGDDAVIADLLHRIGDHLTDLGVAIGRNGADLGHFLGVLDRLGLVGNVLDDFTHGHVDAALEVHGVHARGHGLGAFLDDRLRQNGRGRGTVAGNVVGLGGDFAHHLRAHVLELVLQFDFLGDRHTVLGDARRAEGLVEHDIAAFGAKRDLHGIGQYIDAPEHLVAGVR